MARRYVFAVSVPLILRNREAFSIISAVLG
jgi:hypothetical protein